jgi:hypothetical protein
MSHEPLRASVIAPRPQDASRSTPDSRRIVPRPIESHAPAGPPAEGALSFEERAPVVERQRVAWSATHGRARAVPRMALDALVRAVATLSVRWRDDDDPRTYR